MQVAIVHQQAADDQMTRSRPSSTDPAPGRKAASGRSSPGQAARVLAGQKPGRSGKPRSTPMHAFLLWIAVSMAALAVASATFLVVAAPTDLVRDQIIAEVRERTGRDLTVAGGTSLTMFPSMGISLHDVSLSQPSGMGGEPMVHVAEMDVKIPLWPLLRGEMKVEQLVIRRPVLALRIDREGRRNWEFRRPREGDSGPARGAGGGLGGSSELQKLALANVRIEDGTVRYVDERRQFREEITGLHLELSLESLASPLEAEGDLTLRGEKVDFRGRLDSLATLMAGSPSHLTVRLSGQPAEADYEGTFSTAPVTRLAGQLTVKSGSLRGLAAWAGTPFRDDEADGPLSLSGKLETTATSIALTDADGDFGSTKARGFAVFENRDGARPRISADLRLSALDLGRWLIDAGNRSGTSAKRNDGKPPTSGEAGPPRTIDDLLKGTTADEPQVRGFLARHGWSEVQLDTAFLSRADADLKLHIDRLSYRDIIAADARITATLVDRVLDATINDMQLYEGSGRGTIRLDASGASTAVETDLRLDDISALELLRDAAEFDWIAGKGDVSLTLMGQGRSEREIVETLDGKAEFAFANGALVGIDVPGIIRNLQEGRVPRLERDASDRTGFSELAASFAIKNGIAENRDLRLVSSLVRVTGGGAADLPRRTLDYTIRPKLLSPAPTQDNGQKFAGIELPIRISGPWDRPSYSADVDAVLQNPGDVVEAAKEIGKQFKGKKLKDALRDLLGDDNDENGSGSKPKARDLLRQFLKP